MRNLKRALSLALAAAMLISLMVVGASAASYEDYSDASGVQNVEAVDLLTSLGIVGGDQNGNFNPTATLTRAEYCVMIANLLSGGNFDPALFDGTTTPFTDVQGHWGAGYIAYCYSNGVIAGTSATTFSPDATLTAAQASAILLSALGYNQNSEFAANGQFEVNVTKWAQQSGLYHDLVVSATAGLSRDNAAQVIFNALTYVTPVSYSALGGTYYTVGTSAVSGVVLTADQTISGIAGTGYDYTIAAKNFEIETDSKVDNGVSGYVWKDANSSTVLSGFYANDDTLATVTDGTVISKLTTKSDSKFKAELDTTGTINFYYNGTAIGNSASVSAAGDLYVDSNKVLVSAAATANTTTDPEYTVKGAIVTLLDKNESGVYDGKAETVTIVEKSVVELTRDVTTTTSGSVTSLRAAIGTGDNAIPANTNVENITGYQNLAKGDVVEYWKMASDYNGDAHYYIQEIAPVTVTINSVDLANGKVTASGTTYEQSGLVTYVKGSNTLSNLASGNLNKDATFYVDDLGYVVMVKDIDAVNNYLVVLAATYDSISETARIRAVDETGTVFSADVSKVFVGSAEQTLSSYAGTMASNKGKVVYKYVETSDGYELTAYPTTGTTGSLIMQTGTNWGGTKITRNNATLNIGIANLYGNDNTIFIVKDGTNYKLYTGIKNVPTITGNIANVYTSVYESGTNNIAKFVYVDAQGGVVGSVTTDDVIFITSKNAVETKVGDDSYYTYNAVVNGAATTITATSAGKSSIDAAFTGAGNTIGLVTVTSRDGDYVTAVSAEAAAYTSGTLNAKNIASVGNGIIIGTAAIPGTDSKTTMQYNADTQVVILDKDGNVDVDATVDDIDVDYDYVMITPASDNENLADIIYVVQR